MSSFATPAGAPHDVLTIRGHPIAAANLTLTTPSIAEARNAEQALRIALTGAVHTGFGLGHRNLRVWHYRPGLIGNFAGDNARVVLRECGYCQQKD